MAQETRHRVFSMVHASQQRGASREQIEQHKDQIYSAAAQDAKERVKLAFLIQKIAEKEDIKVSEDEINGRLLRLAATNRVPLEKFVKDLRQRGGLIEVYDQIMHGKVMDFLEKNAQLIEAPPGSMSER